MSAPAPIAPGSSGWNFDHSYARLPAMLHEHLEPTPVKEPRMVVFNHALAQSLGLDAAALENQPAIFAGNQLPDGSSPLAQAYAGHQYGHFTGLGDGRAILLGEQLTPTGERYDVQLKGSGPTPFSRRGDGRAALGPMLREYIISEAMFALGIPTTRSLAVVTTGEKVFRQESLPGAVLTRIAASHIRVGTFEWAAAHGDRVALQALADYTLRRHYPELASAEAPHLALLEAVMERQARLIAQWQCVGFIHGVMNTDNVALSGETIDYGPCAFMDAFDPATVFSSIDRQGRYAYGNQPQIAQWNLARLAEALLPLLHADEKQAVQIANTAIESFKTTFERHWLSGMQAKLGLFTEEADDRALVESLLVWMQEQKADFTNAFRSLSNDGKTMLYDDPAFTTWHAQWQARLKRQPQSADEVQQRMRAHSPAVIPRNHKVEEALSAAVERGDLSVMQRLLEVLAKPYDASEVQPDYSAPSGLAPGAYQTFCGT
ncbi:MAG: YdiU family protein [Prosthecobacter sp.]|uniref:protein adenylyltransferase SelO n=1 Tax=Prosthecobacter sp. TaxID=1965333 RepID=UPI0025EF8AE0|nr:YdiU family protein [Prosthecobacter sp.]MCF7785280.1 YdiU family protein [Prosthecobacter sp.]